jgi:hypothetical protein
MCISLICLLLAMGVLLLSPYQPPRKPSLSSHGAINSYGNKQSVANKFSSIKGQLSIKLTDLDKPITGSSTNQLNRREPSSVRMRVRVYATEQAFVLCTKFSHVHPCYGPT